MSRNLIITTGEGQTGHLIVELLLSDPQFSDKLKALHVTTFNPEHPHITEMADRVSVIPAVPGKKDELVKSMKDANADTIMIIPPSVENKLEVTKEMIEATKEAGIPNVVLLSSAGCDLAERDTQPRLREFVDIETLVMQSKGDTETETGHSPCIIR